MPEQTRCGLNWAQLSTRDCKWIPLVPVTGKLGFGSLWKREINPAAPAAQVGFFLHFCLISQLEAKPGLSFGDFLHEPGTDFPWAEPPECHPKAWELCCWKGAVTSPGVPVPGCAPEGSTKIQVVFSHSWSWAGAGIFSHPSSATEKLSGF